MGLVSSSESNTNKESKMPEEKSSETLEEVPDPEARIGYNNYMLANQAQLGQLGQNNYMLGNKGQLAGQSNQLSLLNQYQNQYGQASNKVNSIKLNSQLGSDDYDYSLGSTGTASNYAQTSNSNSNKNNGNGVGYLDYFDYDSTNYSPAYQNYDVGMGLGNGMGGGYGGNNINYRKLLRRRNGLMSGGLGQLGNGQLGGQMNGQLGGQLNNRADSLGLGSTGWGATGGGYGGGATGYGNAGAGSGYGGYGPISIVSGYGAGNQQCETGINPLLALLTLAGAAVGFYFIYIRLTMSGGRKLKSSYVDDVADMMWLGKA